LNASTLVQKIWNFCNTLRDDGVGYGDYLEQLTSLLFLKLAHEYSQPPHNRELKIRRTLSGSFAKAGREARHARRDLLQGPEQDSRPRQAVALGADDRLGELA
jgi:type I restriction-modification system DNA methylase subunit